MDFEKEYTTITARTLDEVLKLIQGGFMSGLRAENASLGYNPVTHSLFIVADFACMFGNNESIAPQIGQETSDRILASLGADREGFLKYLRQRQNSEIEKARDVLLRIHGETYVESVAKTKEQFNGLSKLLNHEE